MFYFKSRRFFLLPLKLNSKFIAIFIPLEFSMNTFVKLHIFGKLHKIGMELENGIILFDETL